MIARVVLILLAVCAAAAQAGIATTRPAVLEFTGDQRDGIGREIRDVIAAQLSSESVDRSTVQISGSYEHIGSEIQFTGSVTDTATGKTLGRLIARGEYRDLDALEDIIAGQACRALRKPIVIPVHSSRRVGEGSSSGPLADPNARHTPWDHPYVDTDAIDSMNNLRYGDLDLLSPYFGFGSYGFGYGFAWTGSFGYGFNVGWGGLPW